MISKADDDPAQTKDQNRLVSWARNFHYKLTKFTFLPCFLSKFSVLSTSPCSSIRFSLHLSFRQVLLTNEFYLIIFVV